MLSRTLLQRPTTLKTLARYTMLSTQARSQSGLVKEVHSFDEFKQSIKDSKLSIIDFYAVWCGPCKLISPILEKFLAQYEADTQFLKVNVDEQSEIAQEYGVSAMPTFMLFKNGEGIGKIVGANPNGLQKAIEQYK